MTTETILTDTKRAAFEAACAQHAEDAGYESHERLARDVDGYADPHTQAAWWGWCEALQSPEIQALRKDALFGRVAMRFVDRAGDYCKEDPAEKICDEFNAAIHAAMEQQK